MGRLNDQLFSIIISVPAVVIAFTIQGYAKAFVADRLGDKTPRFQGRLTLNPAAHIDLIGLIMILICHFGWSKPMETNPRAYKRGYKDSIKVSIAAPLGNLIAGFLGALLYVAFIKFFYFSIPQSVYVVLVNMILAILSVNVGLAIFNLLPLPGLAGFDIFRDLAPKKFYQVADKIYQYQFIILIGVIVIGGTIISIPASAIINGFIYIARIIFRI